MAANLLGLVLEGRMLVDHRLGPLRPSFAKTREAAAAAKPKRAGVTYLLPSSSSLVP